MRWRNRGRIIRAGRCQGTINGRRAQARRPFSFAHSVARTLWVGLCAATFLLPLDVMAAQQPGYSLAAIREMAAAGASGLALQHLREAQPAVGDAPGIWARWEQARSHILEAAGARRRAIERLASLPAAAPSSFRRWSLQRRSILHLALGQADRARGLARRLLWRDGTRAPDDSRRRWRLLVVRSYLVAGRIDDAVTALRRFEQDYPDTAGRWPALRARILLRAGRPGEVVGHEEDEVSGEVRALGLLARLRSERIDASRAWNRARTAALDDTTAAVDRARFWFVATEAATRASLTPERALATERTVAGSTALPATDGLFRLDGDAVWSAWIACGTDYGNEHELLIGDDAAWLQAVAAVRPDAPVWARSLLAVIATRGDGTVARQAHRRLFESLADNGPGLTVARAAYLDSQRFPRLQQIPAIVRYRLVDDALQRDDMGLATRLMADLCAAPDDVSTYAWRLLRARVLALGGRRQTGVQALQSLLSDYPELAGKALDRFLQVVFDLQDAQAHQPALQLLRRLGERDLPGQRRRELLYWRAQSHEGLDQPRRAAELYLRSATLLDGRGGDPWGQTARYQAGRMLARAGLVNDARRVYRALLRVTDSHERRATLRQRLQKLGLHRAAPDNIAPSDASR